ncbi:MAG: hypothetical protein RL168_879, partial [Bacteroidota bacterium]
MRPAIIVLFRGAPNVNNGHYAVGHVVGYRIGQGVVGNFPGP